MLVLSIGHDICRLYYNNLKLAILFRESHIICRRLDWVFGISVIGNRYLKLVNGDGVIGYR